MNTNVTSGVKDQATGGTKKMYEFIDAKGGGSLTELMKKANRTKNYKELDETIKEGLKQFLYNDGEGKIVHIQDIVAARCADTGIVPKKSNNNLEMADMEAMADDDDLLKKHGNLHN